MAKVRRRGENYVIDYYVGGKRYRETIGPKKKDADLALADKINEIREGRFTGRSVKSVPIETAVKDYMRLCATGRSKREKKRYVEGLFLSHFKGRVLSTITRSELEELMALRRDTPTRYGTPRSPATCNRELAAIRHFLNKAAEWGFIRQTPCGGIKPKKEPRGRLRFLSVEEVAALLAAAGARLRPVLVVALETGMRKEEIFALRWEDVDSPARMIYVPKTKNGEPRHVPMSERLAAELKKVPRHITSPYVFCTKKEGKRFKEMRTAFEDACAAAGITNFRFHDLRHTAASHMVMAGVSLAAVGAVLGHKTSAMTSRYAHLSQEHLRDAVNALPVWEAAKG